MQTRRLIKAAVAVVGLNPVWGVNNWIQLDDGVAMESVTSLAAHGFRLYAGSDNGVFVSEDGGNSWFPTSFNDPVSTLTVDRYHLCGYMGARCIPIRILETDSRWITLSRTRGKTLLR